ncbi:MAG TPA: MBL fold metallo-hydrolase [Chloroflexota bacterium]|nr:MBL fold metallo-hydrolase [Chloroflexota bacterium]
MTHSHGDHWSGIERFPNATWLMGEVEMGYWRSRQGDVGRHVLKRMAPVEAQTIRRVRAVPTPGHTPGTTSLLFEWRGQTIAIVGCTVMPHEHFRARVGHTNSVDPDQARASIELLAGEADMIVPGHDNAFVVAWAGQA